MSAEMPEVPTGSGKHPIPLVAISANDLVSSSAFYSKLFGWQTHPIAADMMAGVAPAGPTVSLRANVAEGFPGIVPFISVADVDAALEQVVAMGGSIERATWSMPMAGNLARFKDASGTIYGLTSAVPPGALPRLVAPLGSNAKPPAGTICSLEMYASDRAAAAGFFSALFGWGTGETIPATAAYSLRNGAASLLRRTIWPAMVSLGRNRRPREVEGGSHHVFRPLGAQDGRQLDQLVLVAHRRGELDQDARRCVPRDRMQVGVAGGGQEVLRIDQLDVVLTLAKLNIGGLRTGGRNHRQLDRDLGVAGGLDERSGDRVESVARRARRRLAEVGRRVGDDFGDISMLAKPARKSFPATSQVSLTALARTRSAMN